MRLVIAAFVLAGWASQSIETAQEQFARLQKQAAEAKKAGEHAARVAAVVELAKMLHHSPAVVMSEARVYAEGNENERALAALKEFVDMGQTDDAMLQGKAAQFAALQEMPRYQAILDQMKASESAVQRGETAFSLKDAGVLAEDMDYDPSSRGFLMTSVLEKKIVRVSEKGEITDFAKSPHGWSMMAIKVDTVRGQVWATESAIDGFSNVAKEDWGRSEVLCLDLKTGAVRQRIDGGKRALGDMALMPSGEPIVSDGEGGGVYRVKDGKLALINGRDFISPQTPAMLADGKHALVPDYVRGIGSLDLETGDVRWVNEEGGAALSGVDGVYVAQDAMLLTQNGTTPERVMRMRTKDSWTRVTTQDVIERGPELGDPTHGVVVGEWFYYIANSGWDKLDEHGDVKPGMKMSPARVMRFRLK